MGDYLRFVKWYFKYSTSKFYPKTGSRYMLGQRERLPLLLLGYVMLFINVVVALFHIGQGGCWFLIFGILELSSMMYVCGFSFLYYLVLYAEYIQREDSVNDRIIVEYTILGEYPKDVARMIQKFYYIRFMTSRINSVRYHLVERSKKRKNISKKELLVLKITPDKIFFNKKEIFSEKITDLTVLEDFLREMQKQTG